MMKSVKDNWIHSHGFVIQVMLALIGATRLTQTVIRTVSNQLYESYNDSSTNTFGSTEEDAIQRTKTY